MSSRELLHARNLRIDAPGGRTLMRGLTLSLHAGDRVAVVGRNGVGKSSLLRVLAGSQTPAGGTLMTHGSRLFVPQTSLTQHQSPGQHQKKVLEAAFETLPDLLLLDEPTHDLDRGHTAWLRQKFLAWGGALLVVSHQRDLLADFRNFFLIAESGCRHFHGTFAELICDMKMRAERQEQRYLQNLQRLDDTERHHAQVQRRRQRKKNLGRIHELKRCPARAKLNDKRSYAQESQGRRAVLQDARRDAARAWTRATRRVLKVDLPLQLRTPVLPQCDGHPLVRLQNVGMCYNGLQLFSGLCFEIERARMAIGGPNGCGKSTLIEIMMGLRKPSTGDVSCTPERIGYIAQHGANWQSSDSLALDLFHHGLDEDAIAELLRVHRFPLALAHRSMNTLSPGERLRAALITLSQRTPTPELLVLDEPTGHLDFVGIAALEAFLASWPGGLVIATHDDTFLAAVGVETQLELSSACVLRTRQK